MLRAAQRARPAVASRDCLALRGLLSAPPNRLLSTTAAADRPPRLFTPGPLNTTASVKAAMQLDLGSRSPAMCGLVAEIRSELLAMAHTSQADGYETVLMQGSGTFAVEAVLSSVVPRDGRLLVVSNGAYGERLAQIASRFGIEHTLLRFAEREAVDPPTVGQAMEAAAERGVPFSHVAMIHHETTTGLLNPIEAVGALLEERHPAASFVVDSMSGFGAYDVAPSQHNIDYLVSSANKNIEGVPGFGFAICRRAALEAQGGAARSLALDLLAQWRGLESSGQFRFTPPTHAMLAFRQALAEHKAEGGPAGRLARYSANASIIVAGLAKLGFVPYLDPAVQSCIITTFACPDDPNFDFATFYEDLAARGLIIYPGKLTAVDCFRIGSIGALHPPDMADLVCAIEEVLVARGVALPVTPATRESYDRI